MRTVLDSDYTYEVDTVDEKSWHELLSRFDDATIYQTWAYGVVTSGRPRLSHLVLKRCGEAVAVAQARIAKVPLLSAGIAYVRWGPVWRQRGIEPGAEIFRNALRALREEFVCRRGLVLRLLPLVFESDPAWLRATLAEEGFFPQANSSPSRTILMDITPAVEELRKGMGAHWKRYLKVAERNNLEITVGSSDEMFGAFTDIYRETVSRKNFLEGADINQYREIQKALPPHAKMSVALCKYGDAVCAGVVWTVIGNTAEYLFGATSNAGLNARGSYLLQWHVVERLKERGVAAYDLNGINAVTNPGTYRFKKDLSGANGKEVQFLGRFDARPRNVSAWVVALGDSLRARYRTARTPAPSREAVLSDAAEESGARVLT